MKQIKFDGTLVTLYGEETILGAKARNFNAVKQDLSTFDFYEETDGKVKIISVAPSLDTGVCSFQAEEFHKKIEELKEKVALVTITVDLPFAQKRFCSSHNIENGFVVSDYKDLDFGKNYGFIIDEFRLLTRGVIVIDSNQTVKYVEYVEEVTNHVDYERALNEVKRLL